MKIGSTKKSHIKYAKRHSSKQKIHKEVDSIDDSSPWRMYVVIFLLSVSISLKWTCLWQIDIFYTLKRFIYERMFIIFSLPLNKYLLLITFSSVELFIIPNRKLIFFKRNLLTFVNIMGAIFWCCHQNDWKSLYFIEIYNAIVDWTLLYYGIANLKSIRRSIDISTLLIFLSLIPIQTISTSKNHFRLCINSLLVHVMNAGLFTIRAWYVFKIVYVELCSQNSFLSKKIWEWLSSFFSLSNYSFHSFSHSLHFNLNRCISECKRNNFILIIACSYFWSCGLCTVLFTNMRFLSSEFHDFSVWWYIHNTTISMDSTAQNWYVWVH